MKQLLYLCILAFAACSPAPKKPAVAHNAPVESPYFDSTAALSDNLGAGRVDTFSVEGGLFRLRDAGPDSSNVIEKQAGAAWVLNTTIFLGDEFVRLDLNGDGLTDLWTEHNGWARIHYYDPARRMFDSTEYILGADGGDTVDTRLGLEYAFHERFHGCNHPFSQLFRIEKGRPRFYYFLDFVQPCMEDAILKINLFAADSTGGRGPLLRSFPGTRMSQNQLLQFWQRWLRHPAQKAKFQTA